MSSPATTQACGAVDPSDVSVSTTKDGAAADTTTTTDSGAAANRDDKPSTSSGFRRRQLDGPGSEAGAAGALRQPRKSLPFLPRTTQYERHPLLQMRSTATGLSEFELLMLERDADERPPPRRASVEASSSSPAARVRPALVPRTTQREVHPLFVRSADSGISELEEYLKEISQMTPPAARKSSAAGSGAQGRSSVSASQPPPPPTSDGDTASAPRKLVPRTSQCERHALLEIKDESGLSELERLLMEKNEAAEAAAADGRRCTVCGAESALRCDCPARRTANDRLRADSETGATSATTAQQKRVRFMQQRQKSEPGHVAAAAAAGEALVERTVTDSNAPTPPPLPSEANSVDSSSAAAKKSAKSRSSKGRGGSGVRADSAPAGPGGTAAHRKSCCVS